MNYYYLIASLPELSIEDPIQKIDPIKILEFMTRNLNENDRKICQYLVYQNDNQNLLNIILEEYHDIPVAEFKTPSIYTDEEVRDFLKSGGNMPNYMSQYLLVHKRKFDLLRPVRIEEYLLIEFYNEVENVENSFVADYFQFDRILRQLAAIHNSRIFEVSLISDFVNDKINRELGLSRPKSVVSRSYPFVAEIWSALDSQDPINIERTMDRIRWEFIDSYDPIHNFSSNAVFGAIQKLLLWTRWKNLSEMKGKQRCQELCEQAIMASGISELDHYDQR